MEILDTTLRDGAQSEDISFSVNDKIRIVQTLDEFGIDIIEAGNPYSNPKDREFFDELKHIELRHARLCSFGSTRRKGIRVEEDDNVKALIASHTPAVAIFGKCWDLHVREILKVTLAENLAMVSDTISYLKACGKEVIFDAEHFFDGFKANSEYALSVVEMASHSGADTICLCDTNGGTDSTEIFDIVSIVAERLEGVRLGIHCHNDIGMAVANTMSAVHAGVTHVQGTFNGIGERCGNTMLSTVIGNLALKDGASLSVCISRLTETANRIAEISNTTIPKNTPYVGSSAFAHKGGMHIDGVNKVSRSFEHVSPERVGNKRRFLFSEVSGKHALLAKLHSIGIEMSADDELLTSILDRLKELEASGYQFEGADASFELLVKRMTGEFREHFQLIMYKTNEECPSPDGERNSFAFVKIRVGDRDEVSAGQGNGPVHALDMAMRRALAVFYPLMDRVELVDYKVRVLDTGSATGSKVRVLVESKADDKLWTTIGVSTDIIEASWSALVDSIEYYLSKRV